MAEKFNSEPELILNSVHFWGENKAFFDPQTNERQLIITGTPEGAGFVAGQNRLDNCLNQPDTAFGQIYTGSYLRTIYQSSEDMKKLFSELNKKVNGAQVDVLAYSFGVQSFAEFVGVNPEYHQNIRSVVLVSPSIGGKSIQNSFFFMKPLYPNPTEYLRKVSPLFKKLTAEKKLVLVTASHDEYVNNQFVTNTFKQQFPDIEIRTRNGTHAINADDVKTAFDLIK
ncbi:MAG: hypothetical protein NTY75_02870 [Candidatus Shapirobacteria bacterium]|nr:hypothetical protein [Candidatus Shapirobacteria bacterium]